MAKEIAKDKCGCSPWMSIVALVLGVVGLYTIILGVKTQWASALVYNNWTVMLYYLVGVLLIALAKMSKHCAHCKCEMH